MQRIGASAEQKASACATSYFEFGAFKKQLFITDLRSDTSLFIKFWIKADHSISLKIIHLWPCLIASETFLLVMLLVSIRVNGVAAVATKPSGSPGIYRLDVKYR